MNVARVVAPSRENHTAVGSRRRTLSIRFFGDDVTYEPRPRPEPPYPGIAEVCEPGEPLRGHWFPQLRGPGGRRFATL